MEKKVVIMIVIWTILINIFSFWRINENTIDRLLHDKITISVRFHTENANDPMSEFLNKIKEFSEENDIEIAQYSFLSSNKVDIYSTMKEKYKEALFIPNIIYNRDIKVHDFEKISDVGFKNLLYIDTKDKGIIKSLSEELKDDYEVQYLESAFKDNKILFNKIFDYMDIKSLPILAAFIFLFMIVLFFYYSRIGEKFVICRLWGYTYIQTYYILNKFLYKPLFLTIMLNGLAVSGIICRFSSFNLLLEILFELMVFNIVIILLLFFLSIALFSFAAVDNSSRKERMSKIVIISYVSRVLLLLLIVFFGENILHQKAQLDKNFDSLAAWNDTENLFNLQMTYSPFYHEDLAAEDILNDIILKVYKDLSDLDKVFMIDTLNFERSDITTENEDYDYNYLLDMKNEEDLYSPHGMNIVVDKNYIKRHTIKFAGEGNVVDMIDDNDDVLNVLMPQKYKSYKKIIENSFKEWFYFQKVKVTNKYKKAGNQKKIKRNFDDLRVNIIYIENNQRYFTYNPYSGDSMNTIEDPIITVYTENIDNSYLASCLGSYMFVESKDEYSALEEISSITQKYNVNELNSISSVYDKKGEEIKDLEDGINRLILNTIIIFLLLIMLMIVITYSYYKAFFPVIIIKSLHGYQFTYIYKYLILANLFINISITIFLTIVYKRILLHIIIVICLISLMDYLVAGILNMYLLVIGEIQFIKGDSK